MKSNRRLSILAMVVLGSVALGATAQPTATRIYIVQLSEPAAIGFDELAQVSASKALGLRPTSNRATGASRFDADTADAKRYARYLGDRQDQLLTTASKQFARRLLTTQRYQWVANGFALALSESEAAAMAKLDGVQSVLPDGKRHLLTDAGPQWIGADLLWQGQVPASNAKTRGEGVVVGIIDTGINAAHPAFSDISSDGYDHVNPRGRRYGICNNAGETRCNDKLIGLYDFVNEANSLVGGDIDGHGSHVAGIAAGNPFSALGNSGSLGLTLSGVAPRANIIMYKACGTDDIDCPYSALLGALNQAAQDGVDVLNYSIGGDGAGPWSAQSPDALAFLNVRDAGTVAVVSAGNSGAGEGTISSPADAPWVVAAANITSNRVFVSEVQAVSGSGISAPMSFSGVGLTAAIGERQIVHAKDFGDNDCGVGAAQDPPYLGVSNPFAPNTFNGQIVICERTGIYARVEKGDNVRRAGAGGMILINTMAAQNTVADDHFLPAVHLDQALGDQLKALVEAARLAGGSIRGSLSGTQRRLENVGDQLIWHSSRGPNSHYDGVLKPNVAAPGVSILAPAMTGSGYAIKSGTSMAAPHIAGAAALLRAAHPTWSVDQIVSALSSTASHTLTDGADGLVASYVEGGAGRVQLPLAVRAGLHMPITRLEFEQANPANGGDPRQLNLSALHTRNCFETCTFTRKVKDNGSGGQWQVVSMPPAGMQITVQPSSFSLAPGASQTLTFVVDVRGSAAVGQSIDAEIHLQSANVPDFVIPVSVRSLPGNLPNLINVASAAERGQREIVFSGLAALSDATFRDTSFAPYVATPVSLTSGSSSTGDAYGGDYVNARKVFLFSRPSGAGERGRLHVNQSSSNSSDVWLFVGRDLNGNGLADSDEELCRDVSAQSQRLCGVDTHWQTPGTRYWVMLFHGAQRPSAQAEWAAINVLDDADAETSIVVAGPRRIPRMSPFSVRLGWNLPQLNAGETVATILRIGADRDHVGALASIPLLISGGGVLKPLILNGRGDSIPVVLPVGQAHERIVVDVPPNASALTVSTAGSSGEVDLYLARDDRALTPPEFAAAPPRGQAQGTSIHPGANETITILRAGTPALTPGRWYVTPVNTGGSTASVTLNLSMQTDSPTVQPTETAYLNPARDGHGLYLTKADGVWVAAWYTYEADGTPVWYLASAAPPASNDGVWVAPLLRFGWNGVTTGNGSLANTVGHIMMTFDGRGGFAFSWNLFGEFGSEPFTPVAPISCVSTPGGTRSISGAWYAPDNSGWGLFTFGFAAGSSGFDANAVYIYDDLGNPRWLLASGDLATAQLPLQQYSGFCPSCAYAPVNAFPVGTLQRTYTSNTNAQHVISVPGFHAPISGVWQANKSTAKLTRDVPCQ